MSQRRTRAPDAHLLRLVRYAFFDHPKAQARALRRYRKAAQPYRGPVSRVALAREIYRARNLRGDARRDRDERTEQRRMVRRTEELRVWAVNRVEAAPPWPGGSSTETPEAVVWYDAHVVAPQVLQATECAARFLLLERWPDARAPLLEAELAYAQGNAHRAHALGVRLSARARKNTRGAVLAHQARRDRRRAEVLQIKAQIAADPTYPGNKLVWWIHDAAKKAGTPVSVSTIRRALRPS